MPVLITAGLSPQAYRLQRILHVSDVVFADNSQLPGIPGISTLVIPTHDSASFVHEMLKACLDHKITKVYPLKLDEVMQLSRARALFSEYEVMLMIPSDDWLKHHTNINVGISENIVVLENGKQIAGTSFPNNFLLSKESGIFSWAIIEQKFEYNLYLIDDAAL